MRGGSQFRHTAQRNHVYLSSNCWDDLWIIQQPICNEIARDEPVLFVERPVSVFTFLRYPRLWRQLFRWARGARRLKDGPCILAPLPLFHLGHRFPWLFRLEFRIQRRWIHFWASRLPGTYRVLWMDNPLYECAVSGLHEDLAVYHVGDDVSAFATSHGPTMARLEDRMLKKADVVFAAATHLADARRTRNRHTYAIANGVDAAIFEHQAPSSIHARLQAIREPRVALVGMMDTWVDVELVAAAARELPDVNFLIVGPWRISDQPLRNLRNVHLVGPVPRTDVPGILRRCAASLIPFRRLELTRRIMPVKIFEALAAGAMPIATDFSDEVRVLADRGLVVITSSEADFVDAVRHAAAASDASTRSRLIAFGRQQTWRARWEEIAPILDRVSDHAPRVRSPEESLQAMSLADARGGTREPA